MSILSRLTGRTNAKDIGNTVSNTNTPVARHDTFKYVIVDAEVGVKDRRIHDIGALRYDGAIFHKTSKKDFLEK